MPRGIAAAVEMHGRLVLVARHAARRRPPPRPRRFRQGRSRHRHRSSAWPRRRGRGRRAGRGGCAAEAQPARVDRVAERRLSLVAEIAAPARGDAAVEHVQHQRLELQHLVFEFQFRRLHGDAQVALFEAALQRCRAADAVGLRNPARPAWRWVRRRRRAARCRAGRPARAVASRAGRVPRRVRLARTGPGAAPASATSMRSRSPRATSPSRSGVRGIGDAVCTGITAVTVRSVR